MANPAVLLIHYVCYGVRITAPASPFLGKAKDENKRNDKGG
jgi:hypothetical protein